MRRSACAPVQSDQRLCHSLFWIVLYVNLLQVKFRFSSCNVVSVAEETGLKLSLSENPKTGFLFEFGQSVQELMLINKFQFLALVAILFGGSKPFV